MTRTTAGMRSLAVAFPRHVRTNDHFRTLYPEQVAKAEAGTLAKVFSSSNASAPEGDLFAAATQPYMSDPFRGTVERRILASGETALSLELLAAKRALDAAKMKASDVDLVIVSSFMPDQLGVGNAAFLARELGIARPAWNFETACASSVAAFHMACGLVQSGQYRNILVAVSSTCSRITEERDSLSWFLGDGAGAFVVSALPEGEGLLGMHTLTTVETCDTFHVGHNPDPEAEKKLLIGLNRANSKVLHETAEPYLKRCCVEAAKRADTTIQAIDFFIFNTPTAWYHEFGARALGVDESRTISVFTRNGNMGAAMMPANLHLAAQTGRIKHGDLVMLYGVGSVATASAAVMRWGDVQLGDVPELGER